MQEYNVKKNTSGLIVCINGVPQQELIPAEKIKLVAVALERKVDNHFEKKPQTK